MKKNTKDVKPAKVPGKKHSIFTYADGRLRMIWIWIIAAAAYLIWTYGFHFLWHAALHEGTDSVLSLAIEGAGLLAIAAALVRILHIHDHHGFYIGEGQKLGAEDRVCLPVPFFHCFGCVLGVMACLTHRCTMLIVEDFNAELVLQALHKEKATAVYGVPTMFIAELNHPDFDSFDLSHLRTGIMAGSPCPPETMREVMERMNMRDVTICYGLTETSPVFTQTSVDDDIPHKCETVGRAHPPVEVRVLDVNDGHICGPGEHGELCCKGYNVMKGYYKMPEETAKAIDANGFLHSGDMGTVDEDGYFRVTGRIKDMIIRGGENIYPLEVENFLLTMPGVLDAQVVGIPDARLGEIVGAFIRTRPGYEAMTEDDVRAYAIPRIARYKVPKRVFFVDDFPMTPSMKVQKFRLREMAEELVKSGQ